MLVITFGQPSANLAPIFASRLPLPIEEARIHQSEIGWYSTLTITLTLTLTLHEWYEGNEGMLGELAQHHSLLYPRDEVNGAD